MYARISTQTKTLRITLSQQGQKANTSTVVARSNVITLCFSGVVNLGGGQGTDCSITLPIKENDILDGAITTRKIGALSVTTPKLATGCVTLDKLSPELIEKITAEEGDYNYIPATLDPESNYHVSSKIYARDFIIENPEGGSGGLGDLIIDDTITVGSKTWSSAKIRLELDNKSPINHQHSNYSLSGHSHSEYAAKVHLHTEYAAKAHLHPEYDAKQDLLPVRVTDGKLVVRDIIAMGDKF